MFVENFKTFLFEVIPAYRILDELLGKIINVVSTYKDISRFESQEYQNEIVYSPLYDDLYDMPIIKLIIMQPAELTKMAIVELNKLCHYGKFSVEKDWSLEEYYTENGINSECLDPRFPPYIIQYDGNIFYKKFVIGINCKKLEKNNLRGGKKMIEFSKEEADFLKIYEKILNLASKRQKTKTKKIRGKKVR